MPLPWVRLDTNLPTHDKTLALLELKDGHRAAFVYCCSLAYCGQNGTDGLVPFAALPFVHGRKIDAERLVQVGFWRPDPMGWRITNWATRQQLNASTARITLARKVGAAKGNCIRWHGEDCGCWKKETG